MCFVLILKHLVFDPKEAYLGKRIGKWNAVKIYLSNMEKDTYYKLLMIPTYRVLLLNHSLIFISDAKECRCRAEMQCPFLRMFRIADHLH